MGRGGSAGLNRVREAGSRDRKRQERDLSRERQRQAQEDFNNRMDMEMNRQSRAQREAEQSWNNYWKSQPLPRNARANVPRLGRNYAPGPSLQN